jgi:pyruvate kinase
MRMRKKTKIICTIGPAVDSESTLRNLIESGMDIARYNFSHGSHAAHKARMLRLKKVRREMQAPTAIMMDISGPDIRTGRLAGNEPIRLQAGRHITLTEREVEGTDRLVTQSHKGLWRQVEPGTSILIDDGLIELAVDEARDDGDILCTVQNTGMLANHKSINLPGTPLNRPALTAKDQDDIRFGIEMGVDFICVPFARSAKDMRIVRSFLAENGGADVALIAKIENAEGVRNAEEIVEASDGVVIARGDLGVEVGPERVPHVQKSIVRLCNQHRTPVIIANQMLDSMMRHPRPARADAADVANAVYDGADALMLTGETAVGKYPVPSVRMMVKIATASEPYVKANPANVEDYPTDEERCASMVGRSAVHTAEAIHARCLVAPTTSGRTARLISNLRPSMPIYAVTQRERVMHRMQLLWGVEPMLAPVENASMSETIEAARAEVCRRKLVEPGDLTVFTAGDAQTSPILPHCPEGVQEAAPTNVMHVVQIKASDDAAKEA